MADNPYQPPAQDGEPAPVADQGIAFNDFDLERVSRATTWMRRVSTLQFLLGGMLLVIVTLAAAVGGWRLLSLPRAAIGVAAASAFGVLFLVAAVWLRQSCSAFYEGIMANAESGLALGFRKLRLYLIMYGIFGLFGIGLTVLGLVLGRVIK